MQNRIPTLAALALVALAGCAPTDSGMDADDGSEVGSKAQGSYALGFDVGETFRTTQSEIDNEVFYEGFLDGLANDSKVEWEVRAAELQLMIERMQTARAASEATAAREALEAGQAFLEENAARPEVTTLPSGVQYEVLVEGDGPTPEPGDRVRLHYVGTLPDGTEFDSSRANDGEPTVFTVGGLIEGFNEAMQIIPMGATYRIYIPGDLAYGPSSRGELIGPNQVLVFEIEHFEIVE